MNDLHRVFFHEVGHFLAHEMNCRLGMGYQTKSIILAPYDLGADIYIGEAKIAGTGGEDYKYVPSREELPYYLASSTYGCIAQAYYLKGSLRRSQDLNGQDDLQKWINALMLYSLEGFNADIHEIDLDFFDRLLSSRALAGIIELDPGKYLVKNGNVYEVDLKILRGNTQSFIDDHMKLYEDLVFRYEVAFSAAS
jgi:hypothetical protein